MEVVGEDLVFYGSCVKKALDRTRRLGCFCRFQGVDKTPNTSIYFDVCPSVGRFEVGMCRVFSVPDRNSDTSSHQIEEVFFVEPCSIS